MLTRNASSSSQHKGWYSRGYLPHFDNPSLIQMITFRLADSMPAAQMADWKRSLQIRNDPELRRKVEGYLDAVMVPAASKMKQLGKL